MSGLRAAIVGFGTAARTHLRAYESRGDIRVVAIVDPARASRVAARLAAPGAVVAARVEELPGDLAIDVVDVCCPPRWHAELTIDALERGHHVLCEKPLVVRPEDLRRIRDAVADAPGVVYPSHSYKFAPAVERMRSAVAAEEIGRVEEGRFRTLRLGHAVGVDGWHPHWRRDTSVAGGGILQDHGTHVAYLLPHLLGAAAEWVECRAAGVAASEDAADLTVGLSDGSRIDVELSWAAPQRVTSYELRGTAGTVTFDTKRFVQRARGRTLEVESGFTKAAYHTWFASMLDDFLDLVAHPARQGEPLDEAEAAAAVIAAAYRSVEQDGERVVLGSVAAAP